MFEAIENKTISEIVIDQIQKKIITKELKVGDQLAPERELVRDLDISRSTLREALKALEVMGVIESKQGNGNFVVNNTENSIYKPLSLSFVLSNGKNEDIMEARRVIEGYTAKKAAEKATAEDVKKLYDIYEKIDMADTIAEKSKYDSMLHYEIGRICDNTLLNLILQGISYVFDLFIEQMVERAYQDRHSYEEINKEHKPIIEAIERGEPLEAQEAMLNHINLIEKKWYEEKENNKM
ncbi:MAG: FadR/GntR family transcriptional regulator [Anaerovoracaceae bacterium]